MEIIGRVLDLVRTYATGHGLSSPTIEIGSGLEGVVYATDDPAVAVKISPSMRGYEIIDMQGDPAIVRVLHHVEIAADDAGLHRFGYGFDDRPVPLLVMWMEHLLATGSGILEMLGIPRRDADRITEQLDILNGASRKSLKEGVTVLARYKAFDALNKLIPKQSWSDMGIQNLGLSRTGQVVVFDM